MIIIQAIYTLTVADDEGIDSTIPIQVVARSSDNPDDKKWDFDTRVLRSMPATGITEILDIVQDAVIKAIAMNQAELAARIALQTTDPKVKMN